MSPTRNGGQAPIPRSRQRNIFKNLTSEQGTSPCSLNLTKRLLLGLQYGLSLRSRHPVRPKGRTAYNGKINRSKLFLFIYDLRNRPARVGSSLQYCSPILFTPPIPHLPLRPPFGRPRVGVVMVWRIGSLKTWVWQGCSGLGKSSTVLLM